MSAVSPPPRVAPPRIAYVMTHYPRLALTFLSGEIDEIEGAGGTVLPIVMNAPGSADLADPGARARADKAIYLKASKFGVVAAALDALLRHPLGMIGLAAKAIASAGPDLAVAARRIVHLAYAAATARACRRARIAHLHAHFGLAPATIAWFAAEIMKMERRGAVTWGFTIHGFQDFVEAREARLDLKAAAADYVVCISDFTRSQLCRIADVSFWDKFHVVRCGIDLDRFARRATQPSGTPRLVSVGRLSAEKGQLELVEALRVLRAQGSEATLELIGDGPLAARIAREVSRLGLNEVVTLAGELPPADIARRLASAHVFCMASFSEGLPVSIMEAMAIGIPVVTTWISGIPELARDGDTAVTVPPANAPALAAGIARMLDDAALRERVADRGRAAVEAMHSQAVNGAQLRALFAACTHGPADA